MISCTCGNIHDGNADEVTYCKRCTVNHYVGSRPGLAPHGMRDQRDEGDEYEQPDESQED